MAIKTLANGLQMLTTRVLYNDADLPRQIGEIPNGAVVVDLRVYIKTQFNASGNNHLNIGVSSTGQHYLANGNLNQAAGTVIDNTTTALSRAPEGAVRPIWVNYVPSGDAATTGDALVWLAYFDLTP